MLVIAVRIGLNQSQVKMDHLRPGLNIAAQKTTRHPLVIATDPAEPRVEVLDPALFNKRAMHYSVIPKSLIRILRTHRWPQLGGVQPDNKMSCYPNYISVRLRPGTFPE